jgi:hypothetical protein
MFKSNKLAISVKTFIFPFLLVFSISAIANSPDPLWEKTVAHHQQTKKWAAKDVLQIVRATKDGETKTKTITKQLDAWEGEKAKYKVVSIDPPTPNASAKNPIDLTEMTESTEKEFFNLKTQVKRTDNSALGKQDCVKFEVENTSGKLTAWVDKQTGKIIQKQVNISIPMIVDGFILTKFTEQEGITLPHTVATQFDIKIPFKKARMEINETFSNWFSRP